MFISLMIINRQLNRSTVCSVGRYTNRTVSEMKIEIKNVRVRTYKISIVCCNKHGSDSYGYVVFLRIKAFFLEHDESEKTVGSWVEMSYVWFMFIWLIVPLSGRKNVVWHF